MKKELLMAKNPFTKLTFEWIMAFSAIGIATSVGIIFWLIHIGFTKLLGN